MALWGASETQMRGVWLQRMYARVLRYLIQRYERPEAADSFRDAPAEDAERVDPVAAVARYREYAEVGGGRPARTAERIRATLDAVHEHVPQPAAGPLAVGLAPTDWMLAAALKNAAQANWLRRELALMGIPARRSFWLSGDVRVWGQRRDFDRAQRAVARVPKFRRRGAVAGVFDRLFADQPPPGDSIKWLMVGLAIGPLLGNIAVSLIINYGYLPARLQGSETFLLWWAALAGAALGPLFGWVTRLLVRALTLPLRMRRRLAEGKRIDDDMT